MERYQEIERSLIKKYRKEIWSKFIKAIKDYKLIEENDKIAICLSGGKDSITMLHAFKNLQIFLGHNMILLLSFCRQILIYDARIPL